MNGLRGKTRHTALLSAVSILVLGLGLSTQALAANIYHDDKLIHDYTGGTYSPIGTNTTTQAGISAVNRGTTINASDLKIIGVDGVKDDGANVVSNAILNLTNVDISNVFRGLTVNAASTATLVGGSISSENQAINIIGLGSIVDVTNTKISSAASTGSVYVNPNNSFTMTGGEITNTSASGLALYSQGTTVLDGVKLTANGIAMRIMMPTGTLTAKNFTAISLGNNGYGVDINNGATAKLTNGVINTSGSFGHGIWMNGLNNPTSPTSARLEADHLTITTTGSNAHGIYIQNMGQATINNSQITTLGVAHGIVADAGIGSTENPTSAIIDNTIVTIAGDQAGRANGLLTTGNYARIDATNSEINVNIDNARGVSAQNNSSLTFSDGTINLTKDNNYGGFLNNSGTLSLNNTIMNGTGTNTVGFMSQGDDASTNSINIDGSTITIDDGVGIETRGSINNFNINNSTLSADKLLTAGTRETDTNAYGSIVNIEAANSILYGGASVDENSTSNLNLTDNSRWTLTPTADGLADSAISTLGLHDSALIFASPTSIDGTTGYQTLTIGAGNLTTEDVFSATGNSSLTFNTYLNQGGALSNQYTDRLLINGNVSGTTQVNVVGHINSTGGLTSTAENNLASEGISLIQVAGTASEDSFKLAGEYVTMGGLPYQYRLYAYGPNATLGAADEQQRLVDGTSPYWDWRLQSVYYDNSTDPTDPPVNPTDPTNPGGDGGNNGNGNGWVPKVPVVAPQVTNYIIAPVALFQAGIADMGTLHQRLGEIRRTNAFNNGGNSLAHQGEVFMRAYGGSYKYDSNRSLYQYGYDADIDYAAVQAGANLFAVEGPNSITRFGLTASYGQLSFEPKNVAFSEKTDLDVWSIAGHASYLHDSGFYLDGILAYGRFSGEVSNTLRGKTADLDGTRFMASLEAGYPIALDNGLVLEPQVQLTYQHLNFDRQRDIDNFAVYLGSQDLLTARIGGRLTKTFEDLDAGRTIEVYAKANYLPSFGDGDDIFLGDNFTIGDYGDAVEGGIGFSASFDNNMSMFGEVSYRQSVSSGGVSGINLNAGLKYKF